MASEVYAIGGAWPLGKYTVTSGTPVVLRAKATYASGRLPGCRQLQFTAASGNTSDVVVMLGNHPYTDTDHIITVVPKGTTITVPPQAMLTESRLSVTNIYIDGATSNDTVQVTAYDAG